MDPIELLLLEPDPSLAHTFTSCVETAIDHVRVIHVESIDGLRRTSLRPTAIAFCADVPPELDGCLSIELIHERRQSLPLVMMLDAPCPRRFRDLISRGAADCVSRHAWTPESAAFTVHKNLSVANMQRDSLRLHAGLTRSLAELVQRNRDLVDTTEKLETMASTDPLTGLFNRWWLKQRLDTMFAEATRYNADLSCMMIDLDNFKLVNDNHGHQFGDHVLSLVGEMIRDEIRSSDVAARYGGDEFIVLLPHTNSRTAMNLAKRLQDQFETRIRAQLNIDSDCSMCIGIACASVSRPGAAEVLIRHADTALYAAKANGPNRAMICGSDGATPEDVRSFAA